MKHLGNGSEYKEERDCELLRAYHLALSECSCIKLNNIMIKVVNTPTSRFWVSEERASDVILSILRGNELSSIKSDTKREMFREIYRRVMTLKKTHPDWKLAQIIFCVVNQPAPKFYLTPKSAKVILHYIKKKCSRKTQQRL